MDPDRWQRIQDLFDAAVDLDPADRNAFLTEACGDDPALRREVEGLITASGGQGRGIDEVVAKVAEAVEEDRVGSLIGRRVGAYEIVSELGRGGMGAVYLAERADEEYTTNVAIKVVRGALAAPQLLNRFKSERQILANLNHANIAQLLDGGTTEEGLPYVVMEYVDGSPIDEYSNDNRLSLDDRLTLFRSVCSAVQHAHRNLIVHRDLKPGNILVTRDGVPKLLDFGIAKLLEADGSQMAGTQTLTNVRPMTPRYASPEQIQGAPITTASDVYALGIVLYELLTGHSPYRFRTHLPHEIAQIILDTDPRPPSLAVINAEEVPGPDGGTTLLTPEEVSSTRAVGPDRLRRTLSGDLDTIVLMALRKEPERRYPSVEQLSEDLRRYQEGLPVTAVKDTWIYRSRKFVRRNLAGVATAALFVLLVSSVVGIYTVRLATERDRAQLEAQKARQVADFLTGVFQVADPFNADGESVTARELLDQGAARIRTELFDQPEVRASMLDAMGSAYQGLALYGAADSLLSESLDIRRSASDDDRLSLAVTLDALGELRLDEGAYAEAESLYREAASIREELLPPEDGRVTQSLTGLGKALYQLGSYAEAQSLLEEVLGRVRNADGPADAASPVLNALAQVVEVRGDLDGAETLYREAVAIERELGTPTGLSATINNLATLLLQKANLDEAEPLFMESLELDRELFGPLHPRNAATLMSVGRLWQSRGDIERAESFYRDAIAIERQVLGRHPDLAYDLTNLANLLQNDERLAEARDLYEEAVAIVRETLPEDSPFVARPLAAYGVVLTRLNDLDAAEPVLREALAISRSAVGDAHPFTASIEANLAGTLIGASRWSEAEELLLASHRVHVSEFGEDDGRTRSIVSQLVELYEGWGKTSEADRFRAMMTTR